MADSRGSAEVDPFAPVENTIPPQGIERSGGLIPPPDKNHSLSPLPLPVLAKESVHGDTFQIVDKNTVYECKNESGVIVRLRPIGSVKDLVKKALGDAAFSLGVELTEAQLLKMTHVERAAYHLARAASGGDVEAFEKLLDRLIGKPKQVSESVTAKFSVDGVLSADGEIKDTEYEELPRASE